MLNTVLSNDSKPHSLVIVIRYSFLTAFCSHVVSNAGLGMNECAQVQFYYNVVNCGYNTIKCQYNTYVIGHSNSQYRPMSTENTRGNRISNYGFIIIRVIVK